MLGPQMRRKGEGLAVPAPLASLLERSTGGLRSQTALCVYVLHSTSASSFCVCILRSASSFCFCIQTASAFSQTAFCVYVRRLRSASALNLRSLKLRSASTRVREVQLKSRYVESGRQHVTVTLHFEKHVISSVRLRVCRTSRTLAAAATARRLLTWPGLVPGGPTPMMV